jgi:hypothetical protein
MVRTLYGFSADALAAQQDDRGSPEFLDVFAGIVAVPDQIGGRALLDARQAEVPATLPRSGAQRGSAQVQRGRDGIATVWHPVPGQGADLRTFHHGRLASQWATQPPNPDVPVV